MARQGKEKPNAARSLIKKLGNALLRGAPNAAIDIGASLAGAPPGTAAVAKAIAAEWLGQEGSEPLQKALADARFANARLDVVAANLSAIEAAILSAAGEPVEMPDDLSELQDQLSGDKQARLERAAKSLFAKIETRTDDLEKVARLAKQKKILRISAGNGSPTAMVNVEGDINAPVNITLTGGLHGSPSAQLPMPPGTVWPKHMIDPNSQAVVDHFVGRDEELRQLDQACADGASVVCVIGQGGEGKSSLIAEWYRRNARTLAGRAVFWCRPYDHWYTYVAFLSDVLPYLLGETYDPRQYPTAEAQTHLLCHTLRERPTLLVLDGAERWLLTWAANPDAGSDGVDLSGRSAAEPGFDALLEDAAGLANGSGILLTTRALPTALEGRPHVTVGTSRQAAVGYGQRTLVGLDDASAIALLTALGVREEHPGDLLTAAHEYCNHALTIRVLAGLLVKLYGGRLSDKAKVDAIADDHSPNGLPHLLGRIAEHCRPELPTLTLAAACLAPAPAPMLAKLLGGEEKAIRLRLAELAAWQLVTFDAAAGTADLHPVIRRYFLSRQAPESLVNFRKQVARWFAARPLPEQPKTIEDITPLLQATEHALAAEDPSLALHFLCGIAVGRHCLNLAHWLGVFGHLSRDAELLGQCIGRYKGLVASGRRELRNNLAGAYHNRGCVRAEQGNLSEAVEDYDRSIDIFETLVNQEGRAELKNDLARCHNSRGSTRSLQGNPAEAEKDFDQAIAMQEALVHHEGRTELRSALAGSYFNRGNIRVDHGNLPGALDDCCRSIDILDSMVNPKNRAELRNQRATAYNGRGVARQKQGDQAGAMEDFNRAIELREVLVNQEGRTELKNELARNYINRGTSNWRPETRSEALKDLIRGWAIRDEAIRDGHGHIVPELLFVTPWFAARLLEIGEGADAARRVNRVVECIHERVAAGAVTERLLQKAGAFYASLAPHVEQLAAVGLDVEAYRAGARKLGIELEGT